MAQRRLLQICIIIGGYVPVLAGLAGMVYGSGFLSEAPDLSYDSHMRYLSGILFAIGLGFWSCVPKIETQAQRVRLLTCLVVVGGFARLVGAAFYGIHSSGTAFALCMELIVTPLLCLWQTRISISPSARVQSGDQG